MQIKSISVSAARTFNHPFERYANFRFELSLNAELHDGEDPLKAVSVLQEQAEIAAETHKVRILADVEIRNEIEQLQFELRHCEENDREEITRKLNALLEKPLLTAPKEIYPGHPEHPETGR